MLKHGSLFSGIGGFDLASEWMGWENVFHCEYDPFCQKVLKHHFPNSKLYKDVRTFDATNYLGRVDILTGGFPCQPFSSAGKRKGTADERHLWPEMLRVIREVSPRYVVGENVRGLLNWSGGLVFEEVCADLENEGYEVTPYLLPACGKNAPHRRDRIWFIAHSNVTSKGNNIRTNKGKTKEVRGKKKSNVLTKLCSDGDAPDTDNGLCEQPNEIPKSIKPGKVFGSSKNTDENGRGSFKRKEKPNFRGFGNIGTRDNVGVPTNDAEVRDVINWENFPTQPPLCGGDDGVSKGLDGITFSKWRKESIKAYGNAIVPQVAFEIFKAIQKMEDLKNQQEEV